MKWKDYTSDLDIPEKWVNSSYGNDALPSYISAPRDRHWTEQGFAKIKVIFQKKSTEYYDGYHIWIDSHDINERKENSLDIYGQDDELAPRFHVCLYYGHDEFAFKSDDFDAVAQWIKDNPKTPEQIEETKKYI